MSDSATDTTTTGAAGGAKAGRRQRGTAQPVDTRAFLGMLTDARKLLAAFQKALKQASPGMSIRDYMILARLREGQEGGAGARQLQARKAVLDSLQQAGLVETGAEGGRAQVTEQGRKVLADIDALLASVIGAMAGPRGAATRAGGRNVAMALKAVRKTARGGAGDGQGGTPRSRRKAATGEATTA